MSKRISVTLSDGLAAVVEALDTESKRTDEIPALSQSRVLRLLARETVDDLIEGEIEIHDEDLADEVTAEMLADLVPDHVAARHLRDEVTDRNWLIDMKGGFEGRVRDAFRKRFKNGYDPDAIRELAQGYMKEAHIYWQRLEDDPETYQQKVNYIQNKVDEYRDKHDVSTYDPDDHWLDFDGVEQGQEIENADLDAVVTAARASMQGPGPTDRDAIADALTNLYHVSDEIAEQAVRYAYSVENEQAATAAFPGEDRTDSGRALPDGEDDEDDGDDDEILINEPGSEGLTKVDGSAIETDGGRSA